MDRVSSAARMQPRESKRSVQHNSILISRSGSSLGRCPRDVCAEADRLLSALAFQLRGRWMSDEGGVAAVDRALSILDALTDDKVTLAELSKRTDLYKSTVLRLLKSLEKFGYVIRTADGSYRLGSKVLHLGALYQRHFRTSEIVPPVLDRLGAELHEGASFYVVEDDKRVCLHRVETTRAVRDSVHVGDWLPLTVGAAGHVLRAFGGTRGERFDEVRRRMYAASYGERDSETAAVAS